MRTSSIIYLAILLVFQVILHYVLIHFGITGIWYYIAFDLIVAIVFSLLDFRGQEKLKNPNFHKTLAIYFVILMVVSLLFWII